MFGTKCAYCRGQEISYEYNDNYQVQLPRKLIAIAQLLNMNIEQLMGCLLILAIIIEKIIPNSTTIKPKISFFITILTGLYIFIVLRNYSTTHFG